jgi:DNA polymerase-3 subunit epsilon
VAPTGGDGMSWHRGALCAGDTETDSPDPDDARVITCTLVRTEPGGPKHREWLLQPERDIPQGAIDVHGVTTERARAEGQPRGEALTGIEAWLAQWWTPTRPMIMMNAPFDLTVLDREFRRVLDRTLEVRGPVVDPLVLDRKADKFRKGSRKLIDTCAHYGIALSAEDAHSSLADTFAAGRLATAILDRYSWMQRMGPRSLHQRQVGWYADSSSGLLAHWKANPHKHPDWRDAAERAEDVPQDVIDSWNVSTEWPIRAYVPEMETADG